jgi:hypothetical protein
LPINNEPLKMDQLKNTSFEMIDLEPNCSLVNQLENTSFERTDLEIDFSLVNWLENTSFLK